MGNTISFCENDLAIGLTTRKTTLGPEIEMVKTFADQMTYSFCQAGNTDSGLAIFYEPMVETIYPDIVLAEYSFNAYEKWNNARSDLRLIDFKILQHIIYVDGTCAKNIQAQLGIDSKTLLSSIENLLDAGLLMRSARQWKTVNLSKIFGIRRLVAVEAKVVNNLSVFRQAQANLWFASESYVLFPAKRPTDKTIDRSQDYGVGVYIMSGEEIRQVKDSPTYSLPSCYGSWLFNEWIGRKLN